MTPDKEIRTLCGKCGTQEVFDDFHLSGKIEGSQTHVADNFKVFIRLKVKRYVYKKNSLVSESEQYCDDGW